MHRPPLRGAGLGRRLLIGAAVLYVAGLLLAPVLTLLYGAFGEGLPAFARALAAPDVLHALGMTAVLTLIAVVLNTVFGTLIAWVLVRDRGFWGRRILNGLVDVPFVVSPVIIGFVLIQMFGRGGLLAPITSALGIQVAFALPGMAIATAFVSLPFVIREVAPVLEEVGTEQELAAYTLGASPLTTFLRVTLPSIRWGLAYGVTLTAARAIGEFGAVLVVSGGVAGRTETATSFIYRALEDRNDTGAHAVAVVLAMASIVLLLVMDALRRRRTEGAAEAGE
jgi:sulfate/thiosulfate transport system permease protein